MLVVTNIIKKDRYKKLAKLISMPKIIIFWDFLNFVIMNNLII